MNIVVCLKQVPDTAHLKFDSGNQLEKESLEQVMNPFCEYAIETALRLKESHEGSKVTAISMGPSPAKEVLKRAIAMGADEAFLLCDQAFAGSDSWTTAYTLSVAIKKLIPDFGLVILGQFSTDGMTGTTGPALAELLGIPSMTFCKKLEIKNEKMLSLHRETAKGIEIHEMQLPGLTCMMKCDYEARIPSIKGVMRANRTEIPAYDLSALGLTVEETGSKGSVSIITDSWKKPKKEGGVKVDGSDPQVAVGKLLSYLREQKIV